MISNIVFFNHYHYGDLFSTREWVKDIIRQTSSCSHYYLHSNNAKVTHDLCAIYSDLSKLQTLDMFYKLIYDELTQTLFINTWVGAYPDQFHTHPTYLQHNMIIKDCYTHIKAYHDINLTWNSHPWYYVPKINYTKYDLIKCHQFLQHNTATKWLFCNNDVRSFQSSQGDMQEVINLLAHKHPHITFIVTKPIHTVADNVKFTNDIFETENDLVEISHLSHYCEVIVGKNSGAFTYANTLDNLNSARTKFICFSHHIHDTLPHGLNHTAKYYGSPATTTHESLEFINKVLNA